MVLGPSSQPGIKPQNHGSFNAIAQVLHVLRRSAPGASADAARLLPANLTASRLHPSGPGYSANGIVFSLRASRSHILLITPNQSKSSFGDAGMGQVQRFASMAGRYVRAPVWIEEEFFVVDARTRKVRDRIPREFFRACKRRFGDQVTNELLHSQLGVATRSCRTMEEAREELRQFRSALAEQAARHGLGIVAAGTHPLAMWRSRSRRARTATET